MLLNDSIPFGSPYRLAVAGTVCDDGTYIMATRARERMIDETGTFQPRLVVNMRTMARSGTAEIGVVILHLPEQIEGQEYDLLSVACLVHMEAIQIIVSPGLHETTKEEQIEGQE